MHVTHVPVLVVREAKRQNRDRAGRHFGEPGIDHLGGEVVARAGRGEASRGGAIT